MAAIFAPTRRVSCRRCCASRAPRPVPRRCATSGTTAGACSRSSPCSPANGWRAGVLASPDPSVLLRNESPLGDRLVIVVGVLLRAIRQLDLRRLQFLVGNGAEQMRDQVEARRLLVVGAHEV